MAKVEDLLDSLALLSFGNGGNCDKAHRFLEKIAMQLEKSLEKSKIAAFTLDIRARFFVPPRNEDLVVMFSDGSGAYLFKDGFATPMGNITKEFASWEEVKV